MFVQLPRELLKWKVEKVGFYKPYHKTFHNKMPRYMDIVVVLFHAKPMEIEQDLHPAVNIPKWEDRAAELPGSTAASFAWIAGRSLGGAVTAKDGQLEVTTVDPEDWRGGRAMAFYLDRGEPGDNGTLLLSYDQVKSPKFLGVFLGFVAPSNAFAERRGIAATIPPFDMLTWLPVSEKKITKVLLHSNSFGWASFWKKITKVTKVLRVDEGVRLGGSKSDVYGIFVDAEQPIKYTGNTVSFSELMTGEAPP